MLSAIKCGGTACMASHRNVGSFGNESFGVLYFMFRIPELPVINVHSIEIMWITEATTWVWQGYVYHSCICICQTGIRLQNGKLIRCCNKAVLHLECIYFTHLGKKMYTQPSTADMIFTRIKKKMSKVVCCLHKISSCLDEKIWMNEVSNGALLVPGLCSTIYTDKACN